MKCKMSYGILDLLYTKWKLFVSKINRNDVNTGIMHIHESPSEEVEKQKSLLENPLLIAFHRHNGKDDRHYYRHQLFALKTFCEKVETLVQEKEPESYIEKITRWNYRLQLSPGVFYGAMILLDRYGEKVTFHHATTILMLASKLIDDVPYSNDFWSYKMDISLQKLNKMEMEILQKLNFQISISLEEFLDVSSSFNK